MNITEKTFESEFFIYIDKYFRISLQLVSLQKRNHIREQGFANHKKKSEKIKKLKKNVAKKIKNK